jgi:tetratricopeptide (TPR) repeat protein
MLSAMGFATQIRDAFKTAVELDPKAVEPRVSLLQYYLQAPSIVGGGKDKARALAEDTRKVSVPAASLMQATLLMSDEKLREAEPLVLQLNPGDDELLKDLHRGTLVGLTAEYVRTKLFADAQRMAAELARRYPNNVWAAYGQGRVLQETSKCGEAIAHFERALTLEKPFAAVHYRLAQCYQAQGDKAKAISALERALAFKPAMGSKQRKEAEALLADLKT